MAPLRSHESAIAGQCAQAPAQGAEGCRRIRRGWSVRPAVLLGLDALDGLDRLLGAFSPASSPPPPVRALSTVTSPRREARNGRRRSGGVGA